MSSLTLVFSKVSFGFCWNTLDPAISILAEIELLRVEVCCKIYAFLSTNAGILAVLFLLTILSRLGLSCVLLKSLLFYLKASLFLSYLNYLSDSRLD